MKLVLKILALPVLFVVKLICVLGNLLTNVVSYVIGILLLVIGGSAIYCIVKALWQSLLILVVLGIATIAAVFLLVWVVGCRRSEAPDGMAGQYRCADEFAGGGPSV